MLFQQFSLFDSQTVPFPAADLLASACEAIEQSNRHTSRNRYRVYRDGGWYPADSYRADEPFAVFLYDEAATAAYFVLDFDPRSPLDTGVVQTQVAELTTYLDWAGLHWVADRSHRGGVHVIIRLDQRRHRDELAHVQRQLCRQFDRLDPSVMTGTAAMISLPGSASKPEGGRTRQRRLLLGSDAAHRFNLVLTEPSPTAAWERFVSYCSSLAAPEVADALCPISATNREIHAGRRGETTGTTSGASIHYPVRHRLTARQVKPTPDEVPRHLSELARSGQHHSGDRSAGSWALVCGLIEAGWHRADWLARVSTWPELAGYEPLRGHKARRGLAASAAAEWDRAIRKGVRPIAGTHSLLASGRLALSPDIGQWLSHVYAQLDAIESRTSFRVTTRCQARALAEGLARLAASRGMTFHNALRGMGAVSGLELRTLGRARDALEQLGLLATAVAPQSSAGATQPVSAYTLWRLLAPATPIEPIASVPLLEPLWAALGWTHREVWQAVQQADRLADIDRIVGFGNRETKARYLDDLAAAGLYTPRSRRIGTATSLDEIGDAAYDEVAARWQTKAKATRADSWSAFRARARRWSGEQLASAPELQAARRQRDLVREAYVDLAAYAHAHAERGTQVDLSVLEAQYEASEAQVHELTATLIRRAKKI